MDSELKNVVDILKCQHGNFWITEDGSHLFALAPNDQVLWITNRKGSYKDMTEKELNEVIRDATKKLNDQAT